MGGKCVICGYNKCANALHVHHIDPSLKTINFANIFSYKKAAASVEELILEMQNCCLLCANCHAEVHSEGLNNINLKSSFNLELFKEFTTICDFCGLVNDNPFYKYCRCLNKSSNIDDVENFKVDWDKIDVVLLLYLYEGNFTAVGRNLGISDNAVKKQFYKITGYKDFTLYSEEVSIITVTDNEINLNFVNVFSNFLNSGTRYENLKIDLLEILDLLVLPFTNVSALITKIVLFSNDFAMFSIIVVVCDVNVQPFLTTPNNFKQNISKKYQLFI